jgi:hypothetical protein
VGLAAPQVGVNVRLMVFNETAVRGDPAETVLVNPEVRRWNTMHHVAPARMAMRAHLVLVTGFCASQSRPASSSSTWFVRLRHDLCADHGEKQSDRGG